MHAFNYRDTEDWQDLWWRIKNKPWIPYPLRAAAINVTFMPFTNWFKWTYHHRKTMTEKARTEGETIWWVRIGPLQVSYNRML